MWWGAQGRQAWAGRQFWGLRQEVTEGCLHKVTVHIGWEGKWAWGCKKVKAEEEALVGGQGQKEQGAVAIRSKLTYDKPQTSGIEYGAAKTPISLLGL